MKSRYALYAGCTALAVGLIIAMAACGGSGSVTTATQPAIINTSLSDPATCASSTGGAFSSIFVTIKDVQIHQSATAAATDAGWVDLTPNLKTSPQQVDLLGIANNQCFLATLGANTQLPPGTYQQIRVYLTTTAVSGDKCGGSANCVKLASDGSIQPLLLSSEAQTGIKIPGPSVAGGSITVGPGETKDLNIDFDGCASIVVLQGNNQYRLKPVLHAGIVSTTSVSINGTIVNQTTGKPISGGKVMVALEQKNSTTGNEEVMYETTPGSDGTFVFCPLPAGTYDLVAVAIDGSNTAFAPTILTGLQPGNTAGTVPLYPTTGTSAAPATITGLVTSASTTGAAPIFAVVSALQTVNTTPFTIPLAEQTAATVTLTTAASTSTLTCPGGTDCGNYSLVLPAVNPTVGAFSTGTITYTPGTGAANYTVQALSFNPSATDTAFCSPSVQKTTAAATAGQSTTAATLAFTGCQ